MAWDVENTKRAILEAATLEFCTSGLAGARVDRIAAAAGFSKERIYQYFGKKDELFGIVIQRELAAIIDAVSITGTGVRAVVDYAASVFDYHVANPALARLTFWEALERSEPIGEEVRRARSAAKVERLLEALPELSERDARELLMTILVLADGWQVLGTVDRVYSGTMERNAERDAERRRHILLTVEAATQALLAAAAERAVPAGA